MAELGKGKTPIHIEGTPNPNALKFVLGKALLEEETLNFSNKDASKNSPLASRLFDVEAVKEVFIGKNFITISKSPDSLWDTIYDRILVAINEYLESGEPLILNTKKVEPKPIKKNEDSISNVEERIHKLLDEQIRPAVASDGGDVIFDSYKDGVLRLHLQGACSHCPSSIATLKVGIETMLKRAIPELKEVISV